MMRDHEEMGHPDYIGRSEYRIDTGFVFSYVLLFCGLLFFDWEPQYVFLGVSLELAIAILGYLIKAGMLSKGISFFVALVISVPAIILALFLSIFPLAGIFEDAGFSLPSFLGLVAFLISTILSQYQRFRRTTLRQARFYRYLNRKYQYDDGKAVFGNFSLLLSPVMETWITTGVFLVSWMIASGVGLIGGGVNGGFNVTGGLVLTSLCLLRQLVLIGILHYVYRNRDDQEAFWVEHFEKGGKKVVLRQP